MMRYYEKIIMIFLILFLCSCSSTSEDESSFEISSDKSNEFFKFSIVSQQEKYDENDSIDIKFITEYIGNEKKISVNHAKTLITFEIVKNDKIIYMESAEADENTTVFTIGDIVVYRYASKDSKSSKDSKFYFPELEIGNYDLVAYLSYSTDGVNYVLLENSISFSVE